MSLRDIFLAVAIVSIGLAAELGYFWIRYDATMHQAIAVQEDAASAATLADDIVRQRRAHRRLATIALTRGDHASRVQVDALGSAATATPALSARITAAHLAAPEHALITAAWAKFDDLSVMEGTARSKGVFATAGYRSADEQFNSLIAAFRAAVRTRVSATFEAAASDLEAIRLYVQLHFAALIAAMLAAYGFVVFNILNGLDKIRVALRAIAGGELGHPVTGLTRSDEVGDMALAASMLRERLKERLDSLRQHAYFDALTQLPNRAYFRDAHDEHISRLHASGAPFATLMVDLDKFKEINDFYGHAAGDKVLQSTASRLRRVLPPPAVVGRLGGDEFCAVLPVSGNREDCAALAWRVAEALAPPIRISDAQYVTATGTVGIALADTDDLTTDAMINHADIALYRAKNTKRGTICLYAAGMDDEHRTRRILEQDLRSALDRREFCLEYQPQINAGSGAITGFEALVRWNHPTRGRISPAEFVPIAEDSRQILSIGRWTIEHACQFAAGWPAPLRISVNLSPAQFYDEGLLTFMTDTLAACGLDANRLEVEVTEGVLIDDGARALGVLQGLRDLGVRLALDDFGTGYSSLAYLRRFPFDRLKIDRAFVRGLNTEDQTRAIVRAVISLAKALHMQVVAEGVETAIERDALVAERCDELQGFLIGAPMEASRARALIERGGADMIRAFDDDRRADTGGTAAEAPARSTR